MARSDRNLEQIAIHLDGLAHKGTKTAEPKLERKVGTVVGIHLKTAPPTIDVRVGSAEGVKAYPPHAQIYPNVQIGKGYMPVLGEQVVILKEGFDYWVINAVQSVPPSTIVDASHLQGLQIKGKPKKGDSLLFTGSIWTPGPVAVSIPLGVFTDTKNYVIQGALITGLIQAFAIRVGVSAIVNLVGIVYFIGAGTSATVTVYKNGVALSWATGLTATTTSGATPAVPSGGPVSVTDLDQFSFNITATSGTPSGITIGFAVEVYSGLGSGGAQGPPGASVTGPTGPPGTGTRGSLWYQGSGAPGVITGQLNNDFYLNTITNDVYELVAGVWTLEANIKGLTGATGAVGPTGSRGSIWYTGVGSPGVIAGQLDDDMYLDTTAGNVYQLITGTWTFKETLSGGGGGGGGLGARTFIGHTTANLAINATEQSTINIAKSWVLMRVVTSQPCRVRLYDRVAKQTLDVNRSLGNLPTGDSGVLFEFASGTTLLSADTSPQIMGSSMESIPAVSTPITITNLGSPGPITVTFIYRSTET